MSQVQRGFLLLAGQSRRFQRPLQHLFALGEGILTPQEQEVEQVQPLLWRKLLVSEETIREHTYILRRHAHENVPLAGQAADGRGELLTT